MKSALICALVILGSVQTARSQAILSVPSTSYPTIQSAIDAALDGDKVVIAAGLFIENIALVGKHIEIEGDPQGGTILDRPAAGFRNLVISQTAPGTTVLRHLNLRNGRAPLFNPLPVGHRGGGIFARPSLPAANTTLRLENCSISSCSANFGAGIYSGAGVRLELVDCEISDNIAVGHDNAFGSAGAGLYVNGDLSITGCVLQNNSCANPFPLTVVVDRSGFAGAIYVSSKVGTADIADSLFVGNSALGGGAIGADLAGQLAIRRCIFRANESRISDSGAALEIDHDDQGPGTASLLVSNALFENNFSNEQDVTTILAHTPQTLMLFTTLARNGIWHRRSTALELDPATTAGPSCLEIRNCIVAENVDSEINIADFNTVSLRNSLFADAPQITNVGTSTATDNIYGLDPAFQDGASGDFALRQGSPAMNAGTSEGADPTLDLTGAARLAGAQVDMGSFEIQDSAAGPAHAGTVAGGDVLFFNASSGGPERTLSVAVNSVFDLSVIDPTGGGSAAFVLWGYLGVPAAADAFPIPFAGADMAFTPQIMDPTDPLLFELANNLSATPGGLLFSTPAPFMVTGSSSPFPLSICLQGLIEDGPGALAITNAITLHAR